MAVRASVSGFWFVGVPFCVASVMLGGFVIATGALSVVATIVGAAVSLVAAIGCGDDDGCLAMTIRGFTGHKTVRATNDREIASRAAMPIPIGLSFRASQTCGSSSTSADLGRDTGTSGGGMTFGVTKAGFSTGGGLTGGFATTFSSSRVFSIIG